MRCDAGRRSRSSWTTSSRIRFQGGLVWHQEEPNRLYHSRLGEPAIVFERSGPGLKPQANRATRTAIGHPEGYQEAFANLYRDAAEAIIARALVERLTRLLSIFLRWWTLR